MYYYNLLYIMILFAHFYVTFLNTDWHLSMESQNRRNRATLRDAGFAVICWSMWE